MHAAKVPPGDGRCKVRGVLLQLLWWAGSAGALLLQIVQQAQISYSGGDSGGALATAA